VKLPYYEISWGTKTICIIQNLKELNKFGSQKYFGKQKMLLHGSFTVILLYNFSELHSISAVLHFLHIF